MSLLYIVCYLYLIKIDYSNFILSIINLLSLVLLLPLEAYSIGGPFLRSWILALHRKTTLPGKTWDFYFYWPPSPLFIYWTCSYLVMFSLSGWGQLFPKTAGFIWVLKYRYQNILHVHYAFLPKIPEFLFFSNPQGGLGDCKLFIYSLCCCSDLHIRLPRFLFLMQIFCCLWEKVLTFFFQFRIFPIAVIQHLNSQTMC